MWAELGPAQKYGLAGPSLAQPKKIKNNKIIKKQRCVYV
jgi:hypothetical protein